MNQIKDNNNKIITDLINQNNYNNTIHNKKISNRNAKQNKMNIKQLNSKERYNFHMPKTRQLMNNAKNENHHTSNNNNKSFNNTFYKSRNENNNKNYLVKETHRDRDNHNKYVVDIKEALKHGRNTSAPTLKQKEMNKTYKNNVYDLIQNTKRLNYNKIKNNDENSLNKYNIRKKDERDTSYDKIKDKYKLNNKQNNPSKPDTINSRINRINNIKQNYISKTNKKLYKNTYHDNLTKETEENKNEKKFRDILANQKRIAILQKKLKEKKIQLRNNDLNNYTYNNINLNNTINYNKRNSNDIDTIDNEEKIINNTLTEENKDYSINNFNNTNYREITPDKIKQNSNKNNNSYINNYDSIDVSEGTTTKTGISNIKDNSKINNKNKNKNTTGFSYTKKSDYAKKINIPKIYKDKDLFNNNYNLYKNTINTDRLKRNKKKSKKINIINLKSKENNYYFTKSSNIFNTINNKLNKSNILPDNKINYTNKQKKNINKVKHYPINDIKKNNSVNKSKIKPEFYSTNNNHKGVIGKRNSDKAQLNKKQNYKLNSTYEKVNSSKIKKYSEIKNSQKKENHEEIKQEEEKEIIEKDNNENIEKNVRIIDKIGCICHAGEVSFGNPKTNQDNYFNYNINSNSDDLAFVGVCDGHGENGHYVSEYLINHLPLDFEVEYLNNNENNSFEEISLEKITNIFEESFLKTDNNLNELCDEMKKQKSLGENNPNYFNCDYSGSTCISILLKKNDISTVYIANVGDSRAIIIKENDNNIWTFEQLSRDHKPTEEDEYNRIIEADGEIEAIEDDNGNWTGPLRVWEKGSEGPGLAMTRSLGDKVGTKIGVVCTPEVSKYTIKDEDRAFIIASDGLWEYMPNQEVTEAVKELIIDMRESNEISADIIANELFKQAVIRWRQKEPGMDDITIICVLLK